MFQTTVANQTKSQTERDLLVEAEAVRARIASRTLDLTDEHREELARRLGRDILAAAAAANRAS